MTDPDRQLDPSGDDPRPWERPGAMRPDCAPHRGEPRMRPGRMSFDRALPTPVLILPGLAALPLGVLTGALGRRGLGKRRAGSRHPRTAKGNRVMVYSLAVGVELPGVRPPDPPTPLVRPSV
jgi:hypothetical protein